MNSYFDNLHPKLKKYFKILNDDIPEFLMKYLKVPALQRLKGVGYFCGMDHCSKDIYDFEFFYSRFDHSIATALITWHFTHDKKQTIAALLHDIASPAFSHTIDYMNKDEMVQESTEEHTEEFIRNSKGLLQCLKEDGISVEDVIDCKKYSIVDNDRPKLCADRLDSLFMGNLLWTKETNLEEIKEVYQNICVMQNEFGEFELGTESILTARKIVDLSLEIGYITNKNNDKLCMKLLAKIIDTCIKEKYFSKDILNVLSEKEILFIIKMIKDKDISTFLNTFLNIEKVYSVDEIEKIDVNNFYVIFDTKKKCVDPITNIVGIKRISDIDAYCYDKISNYEDYKDKPIAFTKKYVA